MVGAVDGSTGRYCNAFILLPTQNTVDMYLRESKLGSSSYEINYVKSPVVLFGVANVDVCWNMKCSVVPVANGAT